MRAGQKPAGAPDEAATDMLARLRAGDESAFRQLVRDLNGAMLSLARTFVKTRPTAEEVVQDTWVAVISGLSSFEGRSSLKTWIFGILANKARTRGVRDGRTLSFSDLGRDAEPAVDADRFKPNSEWADPPAPWCEITPERIVAGRQILEHVRAMLDTLPEAQRSVILLRDVEGLDAEEACTILNVSEANQRVLLHRGRARLRQGLETLLAEPQPGQPHRGHARGRPEKV